MIRTISTLGCPEADWSEACELARRFEVALELRGLAGELDIAAYLSRKFEHPRAFGEAVEMAGISFVAFGTSFRLMDASPSDREALVAVVPWAEAVGGLRLRVFDAGTILTAAELAAGVRELTWWNEQRAANGWRSDLMIETHDALISSAQILRFLAEAPSGAHILWDTHHTWRKGGEDPVTTWRRIRPHVVHLHVKDSINVSSGRHPFTYVFPGDGEFPMGPLLDALRRDDFLGPISLEWERKWHPSLPPLEEALRSAQERAWW